MGSPVARGRVSPQRRSRRGRGLSPWVWKPPWKRAQQPLQRGSLGRGAPLEEHTAAPAEGSPTEGSPGEPLGPGSLAAAAPGATQR